MLPRVVIIGGGPAGAMAAEGAARAGAAVTLYDEQPGWEKPCGGGVTDKALSLYPFLREAAVERQWIAECELIGPETGGERRSGARPPRRVSLRLDRPIAIFSRAVLNGLMLARAREAGAETRRDRVVRLERGDGGWRLRTRAGEESAADYVVLAAGARNPFRAQFELPLGGGDFATALGYYIPGGGRRVQVQFLRGVAGYIWTFPRVDHCSAGICGVGRGVNGAALRARLERFLDEEGFAWRGSPFYAHALPSPRRESLRAMRFAGAGWAVVGDAAGLVDPITGEGLYYALRSGELWARAWSAGRPEEYARALRAEILPDLELAASIVERFFHGRFLGGSVVDRMLRFTAASPRFQELMRDLFAGSQGYIGLKRRLYRNLLPTLAQVALAG